MIGNLIIYHKILKDFNLMDGEGQDSFKMVANEAYSYAAVNVILKITFYVKCKGTFV